MAKDEILERLNQVHPTYAAACSRWRRYRAMTDGVETYDEKAEWLPCGSFETPSTHKIRLSITHSLPLSPAAVRRVVGQLVKTAPARDYTAIGESVAKDDLTEFDTNSDGRGKPLTDTVRSLFREALKMGIAFAFVDRDLIDDPATAADEALPFIEQWKAEEVINWSSDSKGALEWVVMRRVVSSQPNALAKRTRKTIWRILTRMDGVEYSLPTGDTAASPEITKHWVHNLGLVPLVPMYVTQDTPMGGESYIHTISLADLRKLQFDSDQAMSSHLHGNPRLIIKTARDLEQIAADASQAIKLNPEDNEDARYLALDATGMDVRERLLESTGKQALQASGIEPLVDHALQAREAASGAAMAWSFSRSEEPTLSALVDELDRFEVGVHECVMRYIAPPTAGVPAGASSRLFTGTIKHARQWDLMAVDRSVDLAQAAWPMVKSNSWRQAVAADIAKRVPGNLPPEIEHTILNEIKQSSADAGVGMSPAAEALDTTHLRP